MNSKKASRGKALPFLTRQLEFAEEPPVSDPTDLLKQFRELDKLVAETRKVQAEALRAERECERIGRELELPRWIEKWKAYAGAATFFTAAASIVAALVTAAIAVTAYVRDTNRQEEERLGAVLKQFESQAEPVRLTAAISLRSYINNERHGKNIVENIAFLIGAESSTQVRRALILAAASAADSEHVAQTMSQIIVRAKAETSPLFDARGPAASQPAYAPDAIRRIKVGQEAMLAAATVLSEICQRKGRSRGVNDVCPLDLSGLPLRSFNFVGGSESLRGAKLVETALWEADLYGRDLQGADLDGALLSSAIFANTELTKANLKNTRAIELSTDAKQLPLADFEGASLRGAVLDGACLRGADLTKVKDLTPDQLRAADFDPRRLPEAVRLAAEAQGISGRKDDKRCGPRKLQKYLPLTP